MTSQEGAGTGAILAKKGMAAPLVRPLPLLLDDRPASTPAAGEKDDSMPAGQAGQKTRLTPQTPFPLAHHRATGPHQMRPPANITAATRTVRILVLVSDRLNGRLYHDLLEARGFDAAVPKSASRWIEAIRDFRPDAVLLDLGLSGAMGLNMAREITQAADFRAIPIIVVRDAFDGGDHSTEMAPVLARCSGSITKPISIPDFYAPIEALIARPPAVLAANA